MRVPSVSEDFAVLTGSPVSVQRGLMATLPCWLAPSQSAEDLEVRWYRGSDQYDTPVMLYKSKRLDHESQKASYAGRVNFGFKDPTSGGLRAGDVSLKLMNVTMEDAGNYTCLVSSFHEFESSSVSLRVTGGYDDEGHQVDWSLSEELLDEITFCIPLQRWEAPLPCLLHGKTTTWWTWAVNLKAGTLCLSCTGQTGTIKSSPLITWQRPETQLVYFQSTAGVLSTTHLTCPALWVSLKKRWRRQGFAWEVLRDQCKKVKHVTIIPELGLSLCKNNSYSCFFFRVGFLRSRMGGVRDTPGSVSRISCSYGNILKKER